MHVDVVAFHRAIDAGAPLDYPSTKDDFSAWRSIAVGAQRAALAAHMDVAGMTSTQVLAAMRETHATVIDFKRFRNMRSGNVVMSRVEAVAISRVFDCRPDDVAPHVGVMPWLEGCFRSRHVGSTWVGLPDEPIAVAAACAPSCRRVEGASSAPSDAAHGPDDAPNANGFASEDAFYPTTASHGGPADGLMAEIVALDDCPVSSPPAVVGFVDDDVFDSDPPWPSLASDPTSLSEDGPDVARFTSPADLPVGMAASRGGVSPIGARVMMSLTETDLGVRLFYRGLVATDRIGELEALCRRCAPGFGSTDVFLVSESPGRRERLLRCDVDLMGDLGPRLLSILVSPRRSRLARLLSIA